MVLVLSALVLLIKFSIFVPAAHPRESALRAFEQRVAVPVPKVVLRFLFCLIPMLFAYDISCLKNMKSI